jgi:hypothetical protein
MLLRRQQLLPIGVVQACKSVLLISIVLGEMVFGRGENPARWHLMLTTVTPAGATTW